MLNFFYSSDLNHSCIIIMPSFQVIRVTCKFLPVETRLLVILYTHAGMRGARRLTTTVHPCIAAEEDAASLICRPSSTRACSASVPSTRGAAAIPARRPRLGCYDGDAGGWLLPALCD